MQGSSIHITLDEIYARHCFALPPPPHRQYVPLSKVPLPYATGIDLITIIADRYAPHR